MNQKWKLILIATFLFSIVFLFTPVNKSFAWFFDADMPVITFFPDPICPDPCTTSALAFTMAISDAQVLDRGLSSVVLSRSVTNPNGTMVCNDIDTGLVVNINNIVFNPPRHTAYRLSCRVDPTVANQVISITVTAQDEAGNRIQEIRQVTIVGLNDWAQLTNASFHKRASSQLVDLIPSTASPAEFAIGEEGIVTSWSGTGMDFGSGEVSANDWSLVSFRPTVTMDVANFMEYIRARKDTRPWVSSYTGALTAGSIYLVTPSDPNGNGFLINTAALESQISGTNRVVFIVNGNVTLADLSNNSFNAGATPNSIAILSTGTIRIHSNYSTINAILMANNVDFAYDRFPTDPVVNRPLTINGNLITTSTVENTTIERRTNPVNSSPTLSIIFNPRSYMDLMPFLSTTTYEWRQTQ